ncbi:MAG: cupin domain-containing protein, partial [Acidimicrobiia bacterium]|nr:cupin domain-containing protein [Acidimicrobiia bacterium]
GHALSLQYHERKDETIHVLKGEIVMRTQADGEMVERIMKAGESIHIPTGLVHQMEAREATDLLEASTAELDDVVRLEDRYGRA